MAMLKPMSDKGRFLTESVIRDMTRQANMYGAINLAQGMPDFETPPELQAAAEQAIRNGYNQYAITWGAPQLRRAIADKARAFNGIECDADENVTVCCGATECMMATMMALINPGDEVIVFQPFYENYGPDAILSGAKPVWVSLHPPDWSFDPDELRRAFGRNTKAIIVNTPNNPTGHVFTRDELALIAELCQEHNVYALTDEIYEYIIYSDKPHVSIATLPGMAERTITISGLSKTYSITGWRLGYCIAPREITNGIRKVHDFLTVGAPHPLQVAGAAALAFSASYYEKLREDYRRRRALLVSYLRKAGFTFYEPEGAYYVMTDITPFGGTNDVEFARWLVKEIGVAAVPGSSFYSPPELGRTQIRFMFAKKEETLHQAGERLLKLKG
ncbi:MAG: aminotransferase class I/II-fold pyridoxal phosphate-dependent enzyme [Chloroflexi bacterium]|nr:aminotransferase class I/II-fold pyridoxal phosphate-dependent enzyme [Chloroflexota bacterium]